MSQLNTLSNPSHSNAQSSTESSLQSNTQQPIPRIQTYIPLYRKYRPQTFADLVGQEAIVQTLSHAITLNKVAHAYLFCGPRGTGKTSAARIFAKSLNCEQGPTPTPCLKCPSCVGIANGNALDVIEFDAASNNGVGDARELIENCQYGALGGRFKVYIIDEVHMLSKEAFNALLKTLEEPPPNVIFIFATTEAHKVLPTIISRCQRFDFSRITSQDIVQRLQTIADTEEIGIENEALQMIARHARGGLRDAVGLLDQVAVLGRGQPDTRIGRKDVALFIGTLEEESLLSLAEAIAQREADQLLLLLNTLTFRGIEPIQLLKDLTFHFRNLLLVKVSTTGKGNASRLVDPATLSLPPEYFQALTKQAELFPEPEELPQIIGRLASVERNIRHSTHPALWLEVGLIELAYRNEIHLVKELSERLSRLEAGLQPLSTGKTLATGKTSSIEKRPGSSEGIQNSLKNEGFSPNPTLPRKGGGDFNSSKETNKFKPGINIPVQSMKQPEQSLMPSHLEQPLKPNQPEQTLKSSQNEQPLKLSPLDQSLGIEVPPLLAGEKGSQKMEHFLGTQSRVGGTQHSLPDTASNKNPEVSPSQIPTSSLTPAINTMYTQACQNVKSPLLKSLLQQQTFPLSLENDTLTVACMGEANLKNVLLPDKRIHLEKAVQAVFGKNIHLNVILGTKEMRPPSQETEGIASHTHHSSASTNPSSASKIPPANKQPTRPLAPVSQKDIEAPQVSTPVLEFKAALIEEKTVSDAEAWPSNPALNTLFSQNDPAEIQSSVIVVEEAVEEENSPLLEEIRAIPDKPIPAPSETNPQPETTGPEWQEAKQHALSLFQGKLLE